MPMIRTQYFIERYLSVLLFIHGTAKDEELPPNSVAKSALHDVTLPTDVLPSTLQKRLNSCKNIKTQSCPPLPHPTPPHLPLPMRTLQQSAQAHLQHRHRQRHPLLRKTPNTRSKCTPVLWVSVRTTTRDQYVSSHLHCLRRFNASF